MNALNGARSKPPPQKNIRLDDEADLSKFYTLSENNIGRGAFGVVFKGTRVIMGGAQSDDTVAIKKVNKEKAGSGRIKLLEQEVSLLKEVHHEHIIELFAVYETTSVLFMVFDHCDMELGVYIKTHRDGKMFNEEDNRLLVKQLSSALKYMHANSIAHRDLKMENILVKVPSNKVNNFVSKITDFGLAEKQTVGTVSGMREFLEQFCGTPVYMAPEILQKQSYSINCDVWSLGLIVYEAMTGKFAFEKENMTEDDLIELIIKADFNYKDKILLTYPDTALSMLKRMLQPDPAHRISAGELYDCSWVQGKDRADPPNAIEMMRQMLEESDTSLDGD